MGMTIKSKEHAIRDAKFNEEMARRQTEAQSRYGNTEEVVIPPDSIDIPAAQKEISRLQVRSQAARACLSKQSQTPACHVWCSCQFL